MPIAPVDQPRMLRVAARPALLLGLALLSLPLATSAQAQYGGAVFYGGSWRVPIYEAPGFDPGYRVPRERRLHPAMIVDELEDRGFRDLVVVARQRDTYVFEGLTPRRERLRLVVDAFDGEILERLPLRSAALAPARLPEPPVRRPQSAVSQTPAPKVAMPSPPQRTMPTAPTPPSRPAEKRPSALDWSPINAVPVAPLE